MFLLYYLSKQAWPQYSLLRTKLNTLDNTVKHTGFKKIEIKGNNITATLVCSQLKDSITIGSRSSLGFITLPSACTWK